MDKDQMNEHHHEGDDHSDDDDDDNGAVRPWLPPGADVSRYAQSLFSSNFDDHFNIPNRLQDKSDALVSAVNDFHFAMMNDLQRNDFFKEAIAKVVNKDSVVLEIGTGSGLLAMIAAQHHCKHVYAIEASRNMVEVARRNIETNGLENKITVINSLSTQVGPPDMEGEKADVLVSEILGTLLLGESALDYVEDARNRLLKPDAVIIPAGGIQYAILVESHDLTQITSVSEWGGLNLRGFNKLRDTVSCVFTKQYGFRFSDIAHKFLSHRIVVSEIDFYKDGPGCLGEGEEGAKQKKLTFQATGDGTVHAVLCFWEVFADRERTLTMSTEPGDTKNNFARDMQWGQALQLVETRDDGPLPLPLHVKANDTIEMTVKYSADSVNMQFILDNRSQPGPSSSS